MTHQQNLFPDPSFEYGVVPVSAASGWTASLVTDEVHSGTHALLIENTGGSGPSTNRAFVVGSDLDPATVYTFAGWVRPDPGVDPVTNVYLRVGGAGVTSATNSDSSGLVAGEWHRVEVTVTTVAGTGSSVVCYLYGSTAGDVRWDDIMVNEGPAPFDDFSGDSPDASWDGTPGASSSTLIRTSLVATPQPATAGVLLQVSDAPDGPITITRTDANGTAPVRVREGQEPIDGALTITDYEPALVGTLTYDVLDANAATTTTSTTLEGSATGPVISGVQLPQLVATPPFVTGYEAGRQATSTVHRVVGREDPVVVLGPTTTREGRLSIWCEDHAAAAATAAVLAQARILIFRQSTHAGLDMYFLASSITVDPLDLLDDDRWAWSVACDYVELRSPNLPLLGAVGWTFDDVTGTYPTFSSVRAAFDDFDALLVGP